MKREGRALGSATVEVRVRLTPATARDLRRIADGWGMPLSSACRLVLTENVQRWRHRTQRERWAAGLADPAALTLAALAGVLGLRLAPPWRPRASARRLADYLERSEGRAREHA